MLKKCSLASQKSSCSTFQTTNQEYRPKCLVGECIAITFKKSVNLVFSIDYRGLEFRVKYLSLENSETSNFRHLIVSEGTSFGDVARDEDVLTRCNIRRNF